MSNNQDDQHRRELLAIHRRNARHLEQQIARYGLEPPLHLLNALDHERHQIAELEAAKNPSRPALQAETGMQPARPSLVRSRATPVIRGRPRFRQMAWRTKLRAVRWWQAGGGFVLLVATIAWLLWRPAANPVLVDQLRQAPPTAVVQTIVLRGDSLEPNRIEARTGVIMALTVDNQSNMPIRWLLFDLDIPTAQKLLATDSPDHSPIRRETALIQPGETVAITFVPPQAGTYSFASVNEDGVAQAWGAIEVQAK